MKQKAAKQIQTDIRTSFQFPTIASFIVQFYMFDAKECSSSLSFVNYHNSYMLVHKPLLYFAA